MLFELENSAVNKVFTLKWFFIHGFVVALLK